MRGAAALRADPEGVAVEGRGQDIQLALVVVKEQHHRRARVDLFGPGAVGPGDGIARGGGEHGKPVGLGTLAEDHHARIGAQAQIRQAGQGERRLVPIVDPLKRGAQRRGIADRQQRDLDAAAAGQPDIDEGRALAVEERAGGVGLGHLLRVQREVALDAAR